MDRHADGDDQAFRSVYDLLAPKLLGFFLRQTRDRARAEDLVQQTLLQMHAARHTFVRGSDVVPWAFAIGRRLGIDAHRRTRKETLFATAEGEADARDGRVSRDSGPEDFAVATQTAARVSVELARLPEPQRTAYQLIREDGLSVAQAAEVLGVTETAVKLRAHRVYEALRSVLAADDRAGAKGSRA